MPRNLSKNFIITIFLVFYIILMMQAKELHDLCHTEQKEESYEFINFDASSTQSTLKLECKFLKCIKSGRSSPSSVDEVYWEHKKCGIGLDLIPCDSVENIPWQTVMCKNHSKICDVFSLKLTNLTKNSSGLYRCNVKNYIAKEFKTFKIFELDVGDPKADIRILDENYRRNNRNINFDNQIVYINGSALIRCRVQSLLSGVRIYWGKVSNGVKCVDLKTLIENPDHHKIIPANFTKIDRNLYITKFFFKNVQTFDNGSYLCIAAAPAGQDLIVKCKTLYLNVVFPQMFIDDDSFAPNLLWILLFIPVVIIFVIVCICYVHAYRLKSRKTRNFYT